MWNTSATDAGGQRASAKSKGKLEYSPSLPTMTVESCPAATGRVTSVCISPTIPHMSAALIVGMAIYALGDVLPMLSRKLNVEP